MIKNLHISGFGEVTIKYLVFDYNGTIAKDGKLIPGVIEELKSLIKEFEVYVITADTFGTVQEMLNNSGIKLHILSGSNGILEKTVFVESLGAEETIAIGNGMNDSGMMSKARIGISVMGSEGVSVKALQSSDIIVANIMDAIHLIKQPNAIIATLRS